jgi:hypothetical protein
VLSIERGRSTVIAFHNIKAAQVYVLSLRLFYLAIPRYNLPNSSTP